MPVRCPGCGRAYDDTRFPFGRTFHCTCGARVVPERAAGPGSSGRGRHPRFIADAMLGRLARWLRTLGYDTAYEDGIADADLIRRALEEDRILLTRDRGIPEEWRVDGCLLLEADGTKAQLREVVSALALSRPGPERLFTRCRACNAPLQPVSLADVRGLVPPRVLERHQAFVRCPSCARVYWRGTHTDRMRAVVDELFSAAGKSSR